MRLDQLPIDVLIDNIFLELDVSSLLALGSTCKWFHQLILDTASDTCDALWRKRLEQDLNFNTSNTARSSGFLQLYAKVLNPEVYMWGQTGNGRLGITTNDPRARHIHQGGIHKPLRLPVPAGVHIVDIAASGWSFHALDTLGNIWACGTMDATGWAANSEPLSNPFRQVDRFRMLPVDFPVKVISIQSGRSHVSALDRQGRVWSYWNWARIARLVEAEGRWTTALSVAAGWEFTAILTRPNVEAKKKIFVHHRPGARALSRAASSSLSTQFSEGYEVESIYFDLLDPSLELPSLPELEAQEDVSEIAAGSNFVVALTTLGKVFKIDLNPVRRPAGAAPAPQDDGTDQGGLSQADRERLQTAFLSGSRSWTYLPLFSEMDHIAKQPGFSDDAEPRIEKPNASQRMTHISAQFQNFVVYAATSKPEDGLVLIGTADTTASTPPRVVPLLQGRGVIKVSIGDYHFGALTQSGELLTWGSSSGALGHGLRNKNLYKTGGQQRPVPDRLDLDVPAKVQFGRGNDDVFVFNVAFAGWHSAALAVHLSGDSDAPSPGPEASTSDEEDEPFSEAVQNSMRTRHAVFDPSHIRWGFPARGRIGPHIRLGRGG